MELKQKIGIVFGLLVVSVALFLLIDVNFDMIAFSMSIRVPKVFTIIIAAICVGASAMMFQIIVNNRVLTPSILGMSSLYILIQTLIVLFFGITSVFVINSFVNFMISILLMMVFGYLIYGFLFKSSRLGLLTILLLGTVFNMLFNSLSTFIQRLIDPNEFDALAANLFASLSNVNSKMIVVSLSFIAIIYLVIRKDLVYLDVIALGREQAINLGVNYQKLVRKYMIIIISLVATSTALIGPITFLGFLVTNLSYEILGTYKSKYLIVMSVLLSAVTLVIGQLIIQYVFSNNANLSSIINFVGGIYFIYLILKKI